MLVHQSIHRPTGINVFGSYVVRVDPDVAMVGFGVSRLENEPPAAFASARASVAAVRRYLAGAEVDAADVTTSRVQLIVDKSGYGKDEVFNGYRATVQFRVRLTDLGRFEEILAGVVAAGANLVDATSFKTTRLAELRATARRHAFAAAKRKAELYAQEAGVQLGPVVHVEDLNPDALGSQRGHGADLDLADDDDTTGPDAPGSIEVSAAVMVAFSIAPAKATPGFA